MQPDECTRVWNEIRFLLYDNVKPDINEKDFENQVVRAIEKLGWLEYEGEFKRQPILKLGRNTKIRPDIVIYGPKGNELVAIEIKRPSEDLTKEESSEQLISYMLQTKSEFGLLIGKRIRLFYDGKYNYQQKPLLIDKISFKNASDKGKDFVSIFKKDKFLKHTYDPIIKKLVEETSKEKNIMKLRNILLAGDNRKKIVKFLKEEYTNYGPDVIEGAFDGLKIKVEINTNEINTGLETKKDFEKEGIRKTVLKAIKFKQNRISRSEITKLTGFDEKQISNSLYSLVKKQLVKTDKRGTYIFSGKKDLVSEKSKIIKETDDKPRQQNLVGLQKEVFNVIDQDKNGVSASKIREIKNLDRKQVSNMVYKLLKKGLIQQKERGVYMTLN